MKRLSGTFWGMLFCCVIVGCGADTQLAPQITTPAETNPAYSNSASGDFFVINQTAAPIAISVVPTAIATNSARTTAKMEVGDEFSESILGSPGETSTVAGCADGRPTGSLVCYVDDPDAMATAQYLASTSMQSQVESWAASTGNPDIIVIKVPETTFPVSPNGKTKYAGVYLSDLNRIIIAANIDQKTNLSIFAHELTHAAFYKARSSNEPRWLNEALAVWAESALAGANPRSGPMTPSLTTWQGEVSDYVRSSFLARTFEFSKSQYFQYVYGPTLPLDKAIHEPDVLYALTGMSLPQFSLKVWMDSLTFITEPSLTPNWVNDVYIKTATVETKEIPAYGIVRVHGSASWGAGGIVSK